MDAELARCGDRRGPREEGWLQGSLGTGQGDAYTCRGQPSQVLTDRLLVLERLIGQSMRGTLREMGGGL